MRAKIAKWGHSLALRIPSAYAKELGISDGADVTVALSKDALTIRPRRRRKYRLDDLLAQIQPGQEQERILKSGPVGKEAL